MQWFHWLQWMQWLHWPQLLQWLQWLQWRHIPIGMGLMEASQGEAVVARAVDLQKSWPLLQGFRFLRCCVSGYAIFYAIACHLMYHYCVQ